MLMCQKQDNYLPERVLNVYLHLVWLFSMPPQPLPCPTGFPRRRHHRYRHPNEDSIKLSIETYSITLKMITSARVWIHLATS